jgi:hypothetical protein
MSPETTQPGGYVSSGNGRRNGLDSISKLILQILHDAAEPLETKDIENRCRHFDPKITRIKVFYRLQNLRAEGHLKGKFVGSGKGNWIWFQASPSSKKKPSESEGFPQRGEASAEAFSQNGVTQDG